MPTSWDALTILVILLPGFLCGRIVDSLFVRDKRSELDKIAEALLYAFLIYTSWALTVRKVSLLNSAPRDLLILALYSIFLGLLWGTLLSHDLPTRLLRRLRVTQRTTHNSAWNDSFRHYTGYVQVCLRDGRQVIGWLQYFSDSDDAMSLFLMEAAWIEGGKTFDIAGPGILLTREIGIEAVMFLNPAYRQR